MSDTQTVTIQGSQFTVPMPFSAETPMTDELAAVLNQVLAENLRNNFATRIKRAESKGEPAPTQADLDAYAAEYQLGVRSVSSGSAGYSDVQKAALVLARAKIREKLKEKNLKMEKDQIEDLAVKLAFDESKPFMKAAEKQVAARKAAAAELEDLEI